MLQWDGRGKGVMGMGRWKAGEGKGDKEKTRGWYRGRVLREWGSERRKENGAFKEELKYISNQPATFLLYCLFDFYSLKIAMLVMPLMATRLWSGARTIRISTNKSQLSVLAYHIPNSPNTASRGLLRLHSLTYKPVQCLTSKPSHFIPATHTNHCCPYTASDNANYINLPRLIFFLVGGGRSCGKTFTCHPYSPLLPLYIIS